MPGKAKENNYRVTMRRRGTTLAEMPMALWVIFVGVGMPLLALVLTTVRYGFFIEAARQAADVAAQAQVYDTSSTGAITQAQSKAYSVASTFSGLSIDPVNDVKCWIVVTPIMTSSSPSYVFGPNTPLSTPPDPTQNTYQLRVDISGQIQPMIAVSPWAALSIPGLNAPMLVKSSMTRVFENPPGLYQPTLANGVGGNSGSSSGSSGSTGSSGSSGTTGSSGTSGSSGTAGSSGDSGSSGTAGSSGDSGSSGTAGSSGDSGSSGGPTPTVGGAGNGPSGTPN